MNKEMRDEFTKPLSDSVKKAYKLLWKKLDEFEFEFGKSFEEFEIDDFNKFVKCKLIGKSTNSTNVKIILCKKYAEYIGSNCVQLSYEGVKKMVEEHLKEKEIDNENQLKYVGINDLWVATNRISNDIDVAIVWLLRMGISGNKFTELANLKVDDIDFKNKVINLESRTVEIDDKMCSILKDAIEQKEYYVIRGDDKEDPKAESYELNMNCPYLIKQRPSSRNDYGMNEYKFSGITARVFRVMQELGLNISAINLLQSHATDKLIEYEKEIGKELSIKEAFGFLKSIGSKQSSYDIISMGKWVKQNYGNR